MKHPKAGAIPKDAKGYDKITLEDVKGIILCPTRCVGRDDRARDLYLVSGDKIFLHIEMHSKFMGCLDIRL